MQYVNNYNINERATEIEHLKTRLLQLDALWTFNQQQLQQFCRFHFLAESTRKTIKFNV